MGEVYRAHDTRLNRAVAIKTCKAQFTNRFSREARAIAALNRRHICSLYDIEPDYLVMETSKTNCWPSVCSAVRFHWTRCCATGLRWRTRSAGVTAMGLFIAT